MDQAKYVVACSKLWKPEIVEILKTKVDANFCLITRNEELTLDFLDRMKPEKIFFPHWSHIIKPEIYGKYECIIFHMTDLPYGRGGSPLQNLIVRGHNKTKISALRCESGIDSGPVYLKKDLSLQGTAQEIYLRAMNIVIEMIAEIVNLKHEPKVQNGAVTLFSRRKPEEGSIAKLETLQSVYDYIRMLDAEGYPPAHVELQNLKLDFSDAQLKDEYIEAKVRIKIK